MITFHLYDAQARVVTTCEAHDVDAATDELTKDWPDVQFDCIEDWSTIVRRGDTTWLVSSREGKYVWGLLQGPRAMNTTQQQLASIIVRETLAHFRSIWPNGEVQAMAFEGIYETWYCTVIYNSPAWPCMAATYGYQCNGDDDDPMHFQALVNQGDWPTSFEVRPTEQEWHELLNPTYNEGGV